MGCIRLAAVVLAGAAVLGIRRPQWRRASKVKRACKNDYLQFCPSYEVGSPGLRTCMRQAQESACRHAASMPCMTAAKFRATAASKPARRSLLYNQSATAELPLSRSSLGP